METFTGLRMDRFVKLVKVVREQGGDGPGGGRPWCLPLADRVLLVAVYYRTNLTMRQLAPLFGISPATVCRVIQRLRPLLALEPAPRPVAEADRLWIVDGTLIPVRDRSVGASSRNYRFSANVQVIIDADTRLVIASARPAPGNKADAHVWRESDLPAVATGTTVLADGAYLGTGLIVPHRRRAGRPLLRGQQEDNAEHRRVRARVEHTFARMKNWKILRDCRQKGDGLHHAVQAVATMHNLALAG
ncbi:IS5/IS1182 family transposase [Streptomyces ipomoeae]|uniref:Transposase, IS4 family n=1 Tax=Streptomyces ipomoeae 91-03 TaxID=698759 RepID=L1KZU8_9ACTN|nr:IS5/IS1182 family transposase [Streptomyces ipomoeae]EKX60253.1 transposase, IS4 family [Streptomyces ipomoeae 91-03]EKX62243.1 transposase, IS4 family [Streptomyces ipomoeae 91-03]EKX64915.1 transposase, IS4 family [Streptomyces ipomoeae 91-03]EKX66305.1 transposase, IS4 family [Streptomyces ipomoeae 91-03]EKX66326.1 transposase, IS4 family [Streptomyces ipomoeae 91-03]